MNFITLTGVTKKGGGVGILVSNRLRHKHRPDLELKCSSLENITVEIALQNKKNCNL